MSRWARSRDAVCKGLCTAGWLGCLPAAKGTAGTAAGVALYLAVRPWPQGPLAAAAAATLICLLLGRWAERHFNAKDPQSFVLDEVAGAVATYLWIPGLSAGGLFIGFALFRLFDIWKPFPIRRLQDLPSGLGIVADDLLAAAYANVLLRWLASRIGV